MKRLFLWGALALAACFAVPAWATDQQAQPNAIYVGPVYNALEPYILTAFGVVFSLLLTWGIAVFQKKTGIAVSQQAKQDLQQAATNAAGRILASQEGNFSTLKIDVGSSAVASEALKVAKLVPDALVAAGVTPEKTADVLSNMIAGKIGQLQAQATTAVPSAVVVTSAPPPAPAVQQ